MPIKGSPRFDALTLLEIESIEFSNPAFSLVAHGAFINTGTGATFGSTTCAHWSKGTLAKLKELRACMEQDMAEMVFNVDESATRTTGGPLFDGEFAGIKEHAGTSTEAEPI